MIQWVIAGLLVLGIASSYIMRTRFKLNQGASIVCSAILVFCIYLGLGMFINSMRTEARQDCPIVNMNYHGHSMKCIIAFGEVVPFWGESYHLHPDEKGMKGSEVKWNDQNGAYVNLGDTIYVYRRCIDNPLLFSTRSFLCANVSKDEHHEFDLLQQALETGQPEELKP